MVCTVLCLCKRAHVCVCTETDQHHAHSSTHTRTYIANMTPFKILWRELPINALSLVQNITGIIQSLFLVNPYSRSQTSPTHSNTFP